MSISNNAKNILLVCDVKNISPYFRDSIEVTRKNLITQAPEISVVNASSLIDAKMAMMSNKLLRAIILDWSIENDPTHEKAIAVINYARTNIRHVPIFLFASHEGADSIPIDILRKINDFILLHEDTPNAVTGRILKSISDYENMILPPMYKALKQFKDSWEYSWHTPGHNGGTAFLKTPASRDFFNFYGENLFRSDLSISVGDLGSLLDHSGPIGQSERFAAKVFGAHRTYSVTNGTSTSNRIVFQACVARNQIAVCDRNCHKSIEQGLTLTGAVPVYMMPLRNYLGIIGPIPAEVMKPENLKKLQAENSLINDQVEPDPVHAIVTNSTYDGLCYNVQRVKELMGQTVNRIHFDEAWYGYARFNPIYANRHAMIGDPADHSKDDMTVFCTQSTHKLLAAFSQASFIHMREGRDSIDHGRFNEAFMMHASTSPNYAIIASNDISSAMMNEGEGEMLTNESLEEAITFRKMIAKTANDFQNKGEWFFNCWQPDNITDENNKRIPFYEADTEKLMKDPNCWVLHPGENWHGFENLEEDYCMLDPIKVTITTPGRTRDGFEESGVPACVVSTYLCENGIVPEKTEDFTLLFLFSIGITKGKWGTLVEALLRFKHHYDVNKTLEMCMPSFYQANADKYQGMGLKDLCDTIFETQKKNNISEKLYNAFSDLPHPDMTPEKAYDNLVRNNVEKVTLKEAAGRTLATGIVPYPPGIPLIMPGENAGTFDDPQLQYLAALEAFDQAHPAFAHENHGVETLDGKYYVQVIK